MAKEKRTRNYSKEIREATESRDAIREQIGHVKADIAEQQAKVEALEQKYEELEKASNEHMNKLEHQSETDIRRLEKTGEDLARNREILEMKENSLTRMLAFERAAREHIYELQKQVEMSPFQRLREWFKNLTEKIVDALTMPKAAKEFDKLPFEEKQRVTNMAYLESQKKSVEESLEQATTAAMKREIHEDPGRHVKNYDKLTTPEKDMVVMEKLMQLTLQSKQQIYDGIGIESNTHVLRFDYQKDPLGEGRDQIAVSLQRAALNTEEKPILLDVDRIGNLHTTQGEVFRVQVEDGKIMWTDTARNQAERLLAIERANMEEMRDDVKCPIHEMEGDLAATVSSIVQSDYARRIDQINDSLKKLNEGRDVEPIKLKERQPEREAQPEAPSIWKDLEKVLKELHDEYRDNPGEAIHKRLGTHDISIEPRHSAKTGDDYIAYTVDGRVAGSYQERQKNKDFNYILDKIEGKTGPSLLENMINQKGRDGHYLIPDEQVKDYTMAKAVLYDLYHGGNASIERMNALEQQPEFQRNSPLHSPLIEKGMEKQLAKFPEQEQEKIKAALAERSHEFAGTGLEKAVHDFMDKLGIEPQERQEPETGPNAGPEQDRPERPSGPEQDQPDRPSGPDAGRGEEPLDIPIDMEKESMAQDAVNSFFGNDDIAPAMEEDREISDEEAMRASGIVNDDPMEYTSEAPEMPVQPQPDIPVQEPQMETPLQEPVMQEPAGTSYVDTSFEQPEAKSSLDLFGLDGAEPAPAMEAKDDGPVYRTAPDMQSEMMDSLRSAVKELADQYNDQPKNDKHAISMEVEGFTLSVNPSDNSHGNPYFMIDGQNIGKCYRTMNDDRVERIMHKMVGGPSEPGHLDNKIAQMRGDEWRVSDERLIRDEFNTSRNDGFNDFARAAMFDTVHDTAGLQIRVEALAESHPEFEFDRALAGSEMVALAEVKFPESEQFVQFYEEKFQPMLESSEGPLKEVLQQANEGMSERYQAIEMARQEREDYMPDVHYAIPGDPNTIFSHTDREGTLLNERDVPVYKIGSDRPLTVDDIQEPATRKQFEEIRDDAERSSLHEFRGDYIPERTFEEAKLDDRDFAMDEGDRMNYEESLLDMDSLF